MRNIFLNLFCFAIIILFNTNLFAAEAGMPQLDPKYWASQAFWLILVFSILILGIISMFAMYSTDGGEFKYHTNSHILRFFVFFTVPAIGFVDISQPFFVIKFSGEQLTIE